MLIVLRNQADLITSLYRYYLGFGGALPISMFERKAWDGRLPRFSSAAYHFDHVLDLYGEIFGEDHVKAISFHKLEAGETAFQQHVCEITGLSLTPRIQGRINATDQDASREAEMWSRNVLGDIPNISTSDRIGILKDLPTELAQPVLDWLIDRYEPYAEVIRQRYASEFEESNARLKDKYGIVL